MLGSSRLRLATRRDVDLRLEHLLGFYREIFDYVLFLGERTLDPLGLHFTQEYLESDKLALVFKAMLLEGYNAPIIVVIDEAGSKYVVDGHHRTMVSVWLGRKINSYVIIIPSYKPRTLRSVHDIEIVNPPESPVELSCWRHMVNIIRFLERQHGLIARVWFENILIDSLKPTEPPLAMKAPFRNTHWACPILVYRFDDENYVLDGHHRVCSYKLNGISDRVPSVVFTLSNVEIGIVKTARKLKYKVFADEYCLEFLRF